MSDTIAAIATPGQPSAIGILRLSGPDTCAALDAVFRAKNGRPAAQQRPRAMVLGELLDETGQVIDSVLCVHFPAPRQLHRRGLRRAPLPRQPHRAGHGPPRPVCRRLPPGRSRRVYQAGFSQRAAGPAPGGVRGGPDRCRDGPAGPQRRLPAGRRAEPHRGAYLRRPHGHGRPVLRRGRLSGRGHRGSPTRADAGHPAPGPERSGSAGGRVFPRPFAEAGRAHGAAGQA